MSCQGSLAGSVKATVHLSGAVFFCLPPGYPKQGARRLIESFSTRKIVRLHGTVPMPDSTEDIAPLKALESSVETKVLMVSIYCGSW